jgi:cytoskeleton protein RodZ
VFEIGNSLREARLRQQLDFPEIEQATKIRGKYLRALEEEQFEALPAQTYVKGFLRTYADYLGLDGQLYVDEFNSRYVVGEEQPPVRMSRPSARSTFGRRFESRGVVLAVLAIGAIGALVIAAWKFGSDGEPHYQGVLPASTTTRQRTTPIAPQRSVQRTKPKPVTARLVFTAAYGSCWLQIRAGSANGPQVYEGTLEQTDRLALQPRRRFWIIAGAPGNLVASINGRRVTIPGSGVTASFIVTARGFRQAPSSA